MPSTLEFDPDTIFFKRCAKHTTKWISNMNTKQALATTPANTGENSSINKIIKKIWGYDIKNRNHELNKAAAWSICILGLVLWLLATPKIALIFNPIFSGQVRPFHMVESISIEQNLLGILLVAASIGRVLFGIVAGILDITLHRRITGQPFDWKGMINISLSNSLIFLVSFIFIIFTPILGSALSFYATVLESMPTLVTLNGVVAVIVACLIGDFCFYWSHRLCHNNRFLWNLGHIYHHRHENLTQLHFGSEPHAFFLKASEGFALLLLPLLASLFTGDMTTAGWTLLAIIIIDTWVDPSHSPALYRFESKSKILKSFRWILVTVPVHYTHHSKEPSHNKKTGCNFGARFSIWDRMFGTYVEPPDRIPETGLFGKTVDYCNNPVRFIFLPYLRLYLELKSNKVKHWIPILFGSTYYSPPNRVNLSH